MTHEELQAKAARQEEEIDYSQTEREIIMESWQTTEKQLSAAQEEIGRIQSAWKQFQHYHRQNLQQADLEGYWRAYHTLAYIMDALQSPHSAQTDRGRVIAAVVQAAQEWREAREQYNSAEATTESGERFLRAMTALEKAVDALEQRGRGEYSPLSNNATFDIGAEKTFSGFLFASPGGSAALTPVR